MSEPTWKVPFPPNAGFAAGLAEGLSAGLPERLSEGLAAGSCFAEAAEVVLPSPEDGAEESSSGPQATAPRASAAVSAPAAASEVKEDLTSVLDMRRTPCDSSDRRGPCEPVETM